MPEISIQKQCASLTDLIDTESFGEPIGELPRQTDSGFLNLETCSREPGNVSRASCSSIWTLPSFATCSRGIGF